MVIDEVSRVTKRLMREKAARKQAEHIAEEKTREVYEVNIQLREFNATLEQRIAARTEELGQARDEAVSSNQAKRIFLANMSHELRTPLSVIIGYSEILCEEVEDLSQSDLIADLTKIQSAGHHLLTLIDHVLELSRIEAGAVDVFPETFSLATMVDEMGAAIAYLVEKNNNLFVKEMVCEDVQMYSDVTKVRQVLFNLLNNASKFTEHGTVTLTVDDRLRNGTQSVLFSVADTGIGLSEEQIDKIFDNFVQGEPSTAGEYGGAGLGLAITKNLVDVLDGCLEVRSQVGVGTTFSVEIPLVFTGHASAATAVVVKS